MISIKTNIIIKSISGCSFSNQSHISQHISNITCFKVFVRESLTRQYNDWNLVR